MSILARHPIRDTGVSIPELCFGTSSLGDMPETYTYGVDERRAIETVKEILISVCPFIDSSRNYGMGRSEQRIGAAIRELGGLPGEAIISTKLDRDMETLRFDAGDARRSIEQSLREMGVDSVDILHLHDPEHAESIDPITRPGGAIDELFKMRNEGLCKAVGLAAGNVDVMMPLLRDTDFDVLITHNRFTLVNSNAEAMIDYAVSRDIAVLNAAPYCGGALAKGSVGYPRYVYQQATEEMLTPIVAVEEICARYGIAAGAAALQYSLRDDRVASTICGVSKLGRVAQTFAWAGQDIPDAMWDELMALHRTTRDPESTRQYSAG